MEKERLLEMMDGFKQKAFDIFLENGNISPVAFMVSKKSIGIMPMTFTSDSEKEMSKLALQAAAEKVNAEAVVMVNEAWVAFLKKGEALPNMPVRDMAEKKECIIVSASTKDETITMLTILERTPNGINLGETEVMHNTEDSFTGFMRKQLSGNA